MTRPPLKQRSGDNQKTAKKVADDLGIDLPPPVHAGGRGTFYKGQKRAATAGRKKGVPNKTTQLLKECILDAASEIGSDGQGTEELKGYLKTLALHFPKSYAQLLARVLPYQVNVQQPREKRVFRTKEEIEDEMRARGLPVPLKVEVLN